MHKKIFLVLTAMLMVALGALMLTSCAHKHTYGEWTVSAAATCEGAGEEIRTCSCGEKETRAIAALGHDMSDVVAEVPATCETDGKMAHRLCTRCNGKFSADGTKKTDAELVLPALGHDMGDVIAEVPATCEADGTMAHRLCTRCNGKFSADGEALSSLTIPKGHHLTAVVKTEPSCTKDGMAAHDYCTACGKKFVDGAEKTEAELLLPAAHDTESVAEVRHCLTAGTAAHERCRKCGAVLRDGKPVTAEDLALPAAGHDYEQIDKKAATCTEDGFYEHLRCRRCTKLFFRGTEYTADDLKIPAGHNFYPVPSVEKTENCEGWLGYDYCYLCHKKFIDGNEVSDKYLADNAPTAENNEVADIFVTADFIVGVDTPVFYHAYVRMKDGYGSSGSINQYDKNGYDAFAELLKGIDPATLPVTRTVTLRYNGFEKEVQITFVGAFEYTYYQIGFVTDLGELKVWVSDNGQNKRTVRLSECTDVSLIDGGDLTTAGKKTVTYTYNGNVCTSSFILTDEKTVVALRGVHTHIGGMPGIQVYYSDGTDEYLPLSAFDVEGMYTPNKVGEYRLFVSTKDGKAHTYFNLSINDYNEIEHYSTDPIYIPLGTTFFDLQARYSYADGNFLRLLFASAVTVKKLNAQTGEGEKIASGFAADEIGEYEVTFLVNGSVIRLDIFVYDPDNITVNEIVSLFYNTLVFESREKMDLDGLFFRAELSDGTSVTIPVTQDMVTLRDGRFVVSYGGKTCWASVSFSGDGTIQNVDIASSEGEVYAENRRFDDLYLRVCIQIDDSNCYRYIKVTPDMLRDKDGNAMDLATIEKNVYRNCTFEYEGFSTRSFRLFVYDSEDIVYSISVSSSFNGITARYGSRESVMEQIGKLRVTYSTGVRFGDMTYTIDDEYVYLEDILSGDMEGIDFGKPGEIILPVTYKNVDTYIIVSLIPDLSLYACEEYRMEESNEFVMLYENGYFIRMYGGSGTFVVIDEEIGLYLFDGYKLYVVDKDAHVIREFFASMLGGTPLVYNISEDTTLKIYCAPDGRLYADLTMLREEGEVILDTSACRMDTEKGSLEVFDRTYRIGDDNTPTVLVEGNEVYGCEERRETWRTVWSFRDNGYVYIRYYYTEDGKEYEDDELLRMEWNRDGDVILCRYAGRITQIFKVLQDGTLKMS